MQRSCGSSGHVKNVTFGRPLSRATRRLLSIEDKAITHHGPQIQNLDGDLANQVVNLAACGVTLRMLSRSSSAGATGLFRLAAVWPNVA